MTGFLFDLRGYCAEATIDFTHEEKPIRLIPATPGTPEYETAQFEIRTVQRTCIPVRVDNRDIAMKPGDKLIYSRVEKLSLEQ